VTNLILLKIQAELWLLCYRDEICDSKVSDRKHQQPLSSLLFKDGKLVNYNDVEELLQELGCTHNPEE
jgi:hypothetical protein